MRSLLVLVVIALLAIAGMVGPAMALTVISSQVQIETQSVGNIAEGTNALPATGQDLLQVLTTAGLTTDILMAATEEVTSQSYVAADGIVNKDAIAAVKNQNSLRMLIVGYPVDTTTMVPEGTTPVGARIDETVLMMDQTRTVHVARPGTEAESFTSPGMARMTFVAFAF